MQAASVPLVDPESSVLWRASFAIAALGGAMALIALRGAAPGKLGLTAYISAIVPYLLIGLLAIAPHSAARLGLQAAPLRVEAALLIILVFAGVNVAWLLLFEPAPSEYAAPAARINLPGLTAPVVTASPDLVRVSCGIT